MEKNPPIIDPLQPLHFLDSSDRVTYANSFLAPAELKVLECVLQQNKDIFTWTHSDMPEIHPSIVSHRLNREVEYPDWLANVVVVPNKGGKWRVCVDYTNRRLFEG